LFGVEAGDEIPCDGVVLQFDGLEVDESALTGEPMDIEKDHDNDPFLLSGCTVSAGSGQFLAIAVGKDSQWGIIKSHLEKEQEQTPLQEKLDDMAAMIGYVGMGAAVATFVAMMFIKIVVKPEYLENVSILKHALDAFIIGVTIRRRRGTGRFAFGGHHFAGVLHPANACRPEPYQALGGLRDRWGMLPIFAPTRLEP
jgi:magnesium-transporting ATPase (P-type)